MKNYLTIIALSFLSTLAIGQSLIFTENFEGPSFADSIYSGNSGSGSPVLPDTTSMLAVSGNYSYLARGSAQGSQVYYQTAAFSTTGYDFIYLEFNQIAKLYLANFGYLELSVDSGLTWLPVDDQYRGDDQSFPITGYFNEASYNQLGGSKWKANNPGAQPDNSWWMKETFDLTGLANDTSIPGNPSGYTNVIVRFNAQINSRIQPANTSFGAGWFIDDIRITGGSCELLPPKLSFKYIPHVCYAVNPSGLIPRNTSNNYLIGVSAADNKPLDSGLDYVRCHYRVNGGAWQVKIMNSVAIQPFEHTTSLTGILLGDTVDYRIEATDLDCQNISRLPEDSGVYYTFIPYLFPGKCVTSLCGVDQLITQFPWTEDFEGANWIAGFGTGDQDTTHRGYMPVPPSGIWSTWPPLNNTIGWSVRTGPTGTANTGPSADNTSGSGKYLYTEFSQNTSVNPVSAWFQTPCIDLTDSTIRAFEFYYHKFGNEVSNLNIDIDTGGNTVSYWSAFDRIKGQTHFSSDEPWKRHVFSLEKFIGKTIRVRFTTFATSGDLRDIAIDDLKIFEPSVNDAAVTDVLEPSIRPCADNSSLDVRISIQNQGSDTLRSVPVAFSLNSGSIIRDTVNNIELALGDSISIKFPANGLVLIAGNNVLKTWVELPGDTYVENDTLEVSWFNDTTPVLSQFPYYQDFESTSLKPNGKFVLNDPHWDFSTDSANAYFTITTGPITNTIEGPASALGNGQRGLSLVDLNPLGPSQARFGSRCIELSGLSNPVLYFNYYIKTGVKLTISIREPGNSWKQIREITGTFTPKSSMQTDRINLSPYKSTVQIEFAVDDNSGNDLTNAVLIDNILIGEGTQEDLGITSISQNMRRIVSGTSLLNPFTANLYALKHPNVYSSSIVHISFIPECDTALPIRTGQIPVSLSFSSWQTSMAVPGISLDGPLMAGRYRGVVWLENSLDTLSFNDSLVFDCLVTENLPVPYFNDFDRCEEDFFTNGIMSQWELDTPGIGMPYTGLAYVTNADSPLITYNETEKLIPPFFTGLDTLIGAELRIRHRFVFGGSWDDQYGMVEFLDNGTWKNLTDSLNNGINWVQRMKPNQDHGLVFHGNSGGWITSSYPLDPSKQPSLNAYRLSTESKQRSDTEWEIDYFEIFIPAQNSASPMEIRFLKGTASRTNAVAVEIQNTGVHVLDEVILNIEDDLGNTLIRDSLLTGGLVTGQRAFFNLSDSLKLPLGITNLTIYTSRPNDRIDNRQIDDTLRVVVNVLTDLDTLPYCTDFELNYEFASYTSTGAADTLWNYTNPQKSIMQGAHSGNLAWITGNSATYPSLSNSSLYTPYFHIDAQTCYRLGFWHWYETEFNFDGGIIEMTLDSGKTWVTLGNFEDTTWYNTPYVQALNSINPGFTGSSGGWQYSFTDFNHFYNLRTQIRFRFASGGSLEDEGWMIDDVCIEEMPGICNQVDIKESRFMNSEYLSIFPNPANNSATLFIHQNLNASEPITVEIFNTLGMMIKQMLVEPARNNQYDINLSDLPAGSYLVKASSKSAGYQGVLIKSGN